MPRASALTSKRGCTAIEQAELRVLYQPQGEIGTGRIVGAEALVRWQAPHEGLIEPARFIPVAEATGMIDDFGTGYSSLARLKHSRGAED